MPEEWKQRIARRAAAGIGVLIIALAALLVWSYHQRASESVRVAVLPFGAEPANTQLATVITELLAHRLARLPRFTVLATTRVAGYETPRDSAHAIAQALGVRYLVVGRVDRSPTTTAPNRITIDARLIDTGDSPPVMGSIVSTLSTDLCPAVAVIAVDIAGHFARAPRGELWGPGGATGCAPPQLLEQHNDPAA